MELLEKIIREFEILELKSGENNNSSLYTIRKEAFSCFKQKGFPTRKNEEWKYTHLSEVLKNEFLMHSEYKSGLQELEKKIRIDKFLVPGLEANILVTINGKYSSKLSKISDKKDGIRLGSFKKEFEKQEGVIPEFFSKAAVLDTDPMADLNTAFTNDGIFINIPDNTEAVLPIVILSFTGDEDNNIFAQQRNFFSFGKNSKAVIIELRHTFGKKNHFSNAVTEGFAGEYSDIAHYLIQNESECSFNISNQHIVQKSNSRYKSFVVSWGGKLTRNNTHSYLNGTNCESVLRGIYYSHKNQLIDNHTLVDHATPNCYSDELYKGIIDDNASAVFNGKIYVRKDAQKTNAYQSNKNIVLSETAVINAKPQLEIYADDVKCSHGATTGQINPEELFYLKSRGIGETDARKLLLYAFLSELVLDIEIEPLRKYLDKLLHKKIEK